MSDELQNSIPIWPGKEYTFPAPFETVNAAVFHIISIWAEQHNIPVIREDTPGATRYVLTAEGQRVAIFILQRAPGLTTFSINQYTPLNASRELFLPVLTLCGEEIVRAISHVYPEYGRHPIALTPPCPSWNDDPLGAVVWKEINARDIRDDEFADRLGISVKTLWNFRSQIGLGKTPRGRPKRKR
jgi:hypothetical protein